MLGKYGYAKDSSLGMVIVTSSCSGVGDRRKKAELEQLGWRVITVWECETKDPAELSSRLEDTIRGGEQ